MLNSNLDSNSTNISRPDYPNLIKFLVEPLLDSPDLLKYDCESIPSTKKVWVRLALEPGDKGKFYGRGGRNIHAFRTVLQMAAIAAGEILYLEIYDEQQRSQYNSSGPRFSSPSSREKSATDGRRRLKRRTTIKPRID